MPKKYEREIEEILRNLENSEPRPSFGRRIRRRPEARAKRPSALPSFKLGISEWCLLIAWASALLGGGWAYTHINTLTGETGSLFTGILAAISVACLLIVVILPFLSQSRYPGRSTANGNVTPLHRNPLSSLRTRWNLFQLKLRYRRRRDQ